MAVEIITDIFVKNNKIHNLEKFISTNGCDCYNLPYNTDYVTLIQKDWVVPLKYQNIVPLYAGKTLSWTFS